MQSATYGRSFDARDGSDVGAPAIPKVSGLAVPSVISSPTRDKGVELAASFPLDAECGLRGEAGTHLINHVLSLIAASENRRKRLSYRAANQRSRTVEALLANLIAAALHRFNSGRYVGVPFKRSAYTTLRLSCDAMVLAREAMLAADLIDHVEGFRDEFYMGFLEVGRVTRVRAKPALRDLFERFGVDRTTVQRRRERLIHLKRPWKDAGEEPQEVTNSRTILARVNARLDTHDIDLPEDAWERLKQRAAAWAKDKQSIPYIGDPTAKALYRVFTNAWTRGGRLYGAWWLNIPKEERGHLTIDGQPTVEIDFGHMHPALLYWARGKALTKDPYQLPPYSRDLCKETFQRLINGSATKGGANLKRPKDFKPPEGVPFSTFIADYKQHLHEVADCFGKDVGLILQRGDSDLALAILDAMDRQEIVTLPVHDSFIVQERYEGTLHRTMSEVYRERFNVKAKLKVCRAAPSGDPPGLLREPVTAARA